MNVVNQMKTVFNWAEEYISEAEEQVLIAASVSQYSKLVEAVRDAFERDILVNISHHPTPTASTHSLLTKPTVLKMRRPKYGCENSPVRSC